MRLQLVGISACRSAEQEEIRETRRYDQDALFMEISCVTKHSYRFRCCVVYDASIFVE